MRPTNHAKLVQLFNIGIKKSEQQDIPEYNRIRVHPDGVSAVMLQLTNDGNAEIVDMPGMDEPPTNIGKQFFHDLLAERTDQRTGRVATLDRKRLVEILQAMTSSEVTIHITKSDAPVLIVGGYDREDNASVCAAIGPRIDPERYHAPHDLLHLRPRAHGI